MKLKKDLLQIFLIMALFSKEIHAVESESLEEMSISKTGDTVVFAKNEKTNIRAVITVGKKIDIVTILNSKKIGCAETCLPIEKIKLVINGKDILLPISSYVDIGNPTGAAIDITQTPHILILYSGDGVDAHTINIEFNNDRVLKRRLYWDVSNELLEETIYYPVKSIY